MKKNKVKLFTAPNMTKLVGWIQKFLDKNPNINVKNLSFTDNDGDFSKAMLIYEISED